MPTFDKLGKSSFPDISTVDTYQFDNSFDYSRYDARQMRLTICAVPWDMGEAHIGNRTISGIGNVVHFGTPEARDAWFAKLKDQEQQPANPECYRFETKYKELHRANTIDIPLPFDVAARFNYLVVEYAPFAAQGSLVSYEREDGKDKWFWFIREVEFVAPNTTRLHLMDDAFQTWIYDVDVTGMVLERGHAPMFATRATQYLANPISNNANLLAEDIQPGETDIVTSTHEHVFNAGMTYAVVITNSNPVTGLWGSMANEDWATPSDIHWQTQGTQGHCAFAVSASDFQTFLDNCDLYVPQFMQTVLAVCFIGEDLLMFEDAFDFCEIKCYMISAGYKAQEIHAISKADFGYPARYAEMAKLYTWPYSYIELTDGNGEVTQIHIENTNGKIQLATSLSLVYPWMRIAAHVTSVGKAAARNITFTNITPRNMPIAGNWYRLLMEWDIPTVGVYQNAYTNNEYATYYDRLQQRVAWTNEYDNTTALADTMVTNADLAAATSTAITARSNTSMTTDATNTVALNNANNTATNLLINFSTNAQIAATDAQAVAAASGQAASAAVGAIGNIATGNIAGAVSSVANGIIGGATTMAQASIAIGLMSSQASYTQAGNNETTEAANADTNFKNTNHTDTNTAITRLQNDMTTGSAANTSATEYANAYRTRNTAENANLNQRRQAGMRAAQEFGSWQAGDHAVTRPLAVYSNIVTMSDYNVAMVGDEWARYGYAFNRYWDFNGQWNIGRYFTYWKLSDFWVNGLNVPDMYMDRLRFFLFGGVTIWRTPEDIGNVDLYDNFS